jgi:hypothetical protein
VFSLVGAYGREHECGAAEQASRTKNIDEPNIETRPVIARDAVLFSTPQTLTAIIP